MPEQNLIELYDLVLLSEYQLMSAKKIAAPRVLITNAQQSLKRLEEIIVKHPERPKTRDAEVRMKLGLIALRIKFYQRDIGLCIYCNNYLPNQIEKSESDESVAAERIEAIKPDDIVCTKIPRGLRDKDPMPVVCPHYENSGFPSGLTDTNVQIWERLQEKYKLMLPGSQKEAKKRF